MPTLASKFASAVPRRRCWSTVCGERPSARSGTRNPWMAARSCASHTQPWPGAAHQGPSAAGGSGPRTTHLAMGGRSKVRIANRASHARPVHTGWTSWRAQEVTWRRARVVVGTVQLHPGLAWTRACAGPASTLLLSPLRRPHRSPPRSSTGAGRREARSSRHALLRSAPGASRTSPAAHAACRVLADASLGSEGFCLPCVPWVGAGSDAGNGALGAIPVARADVPAQRSTSTVSGGDSWPPAGTWRPVTRVRLRFLERPEPV